jgi:thermostable 8-oxoguanine DNA glycosylase
MESQNVLGSILDDSLRLHKRAILRYGKANRKAYVSAAKALVESLGKPGSPEFEQRAKLRVAFAILSANCPFDLSVAALGYASTVGLENVEEKILARFQCVPVKARALRLLAAKPLAEILKARGESWESYRERLAKENLGLGRAKATFAACLLYPRIADIACVDTWICKVFLGFDAFKSLSRGQYLAVESEIRKLAQALRVSTFVAQWIAWDHARGGKVNSHAIFPGMHAHNDSYKPAPF